MGIPRHNIDGIETVCLFKCISEDEKFPRNRNYLSIVSNIDLFWRSIILVRKRSSTFGIETTIRLFCKQNIHSFNLLVRILR